MKDQEISGGTLRNFDVLLEAERNVPLGWFGGGIELTATFPSARADDPAELARRADFGVDWIFAGVTGPRAVRTRARIERRQRALRATVHDLEQIDPQLALATHSRTSLEQHLRQADLEINVLLLHRGTSLADTAEGEIGRLAVAYTAVGLAYRVLGPEHEDRAIWAERMAKRWSKMLVGGAKPDDATETTRTQDRTRRTTRRLGAVGPRSSRASSRVVSRVSRG
jgi:hypothetical protein